MRGIFLSFILLIFSGEPFLSAEPFVLEQAGNVLQKGTLETGLADCAYQIGSSKLTDVSGNVTDKTTTTAFIFPFYARYALSPNVEAVLNVPYSSVSLKDEPAGGAAQIFSDSGLEDPVLTGKYSFLLSGWDFAACASFSLPAGSKSSTLPSTFRQGFNVKPLIAGRKVYGLTILNLNASYNVIGQFTDENNTKQSPGNIFSAGIGAEMPSPGVNLIAEFIFNSISAPSLTGLNTTYRAGPQMDFIFGWRHDSGNFKTKFGVDAALGDQAYRAYDYKALAAVTYLLKL